MEAPSRDNPSSAGAHSSLKEDLGKEQQKDHDGRVLELLDDR